MKINKSIIKELSDYLDEFNLTEIEYTEKDLKVKVSKTKEISSSPVITNTSKPKIDIEEKTSSEISGTKITSPIIGTAYLAPEPGGKKFAEKGRKIKKGDTIMIVEAMKTMNHVPCPMDGTIKEICVEDGQPVEFGQTIAILD
jgi:acetyl-CoA carboxylase biotin carboxyl carrier protein